MSDIESQARHWSILCNVRITASGLQGEQPIVNEYMYIKEFGKVNSVLRHTN